MSTGKLYGCAKRNCTAVNRDWEAFETGWPNRIRHWCLGHIPWHARLRLWLQERRDA